MNTKVTMQRLPVVQPVYEDRVNLGMSPEEAQVIFDVFRKVGGMPTTRRKHVDTVLQALQDAGFKPFQQIDLEGVMYFK